MAGSTDNGNSGGKALKNSRIRRILRDFRLIGVVVGVLFWFFESAIHAFLFREGTFVQQILRPTVNEMWMRSFIMLLLVGIGFYLHWTVKRIEEYKSGRPSSLPDNIRRYAIGTAILWTLIVGVSLIWNFFLQYDNPRKGVSVPPDAYTANTEAYAVSLILGHGFMWVIGIAGIGYGSRRVGRELARRKQAEEELYESERRMREMLARVQLCTVMLDAEGIITYVNDFLLTTTGYEKGEIIGGNWFDIFIPAELREEIRGIHKELLSGNLKKVGHYENEILTKDGQKRLIGWSNTLFSYSTAGDIVGSTSIGEDITDRKEAEEKEKQHEVELVHAARLSSMGEMASGLAHEINQPLCAIASFADASVRMFESKRFKHRDILESMQSVSTQARRAGDIIKNMRAFVRKDPTGSSIIDICEVISDSVNLVRGQIKQKQAKVELEFPDESLMATANRVQIEQVIINLIQNSLDAMDQTDIGGREILISACETDDEMILVSVADSGKGFGDVNPSQMFDPFFTTKEEGMGIGLSINTSIIEEHGGKLWTETNESGATFKFTISIAGKEYS